MSELCRSCVKVEVTVLRSQFLILSPDGLCGRKATLTQLGATHMCQAESGMDLYLLDLIHWRYNNWIRHGMPFIVLHETGQLFGVTFRLHVSSRHVFVSAKRSWSTLPLSRSNAPLYAYYSTSALSKTVLCVALPDIAKTGPPLYL